MENANSKPLKVKSFVIGGIALFIFGIASVSTGIDQLIKETDSRNIIMYAVLGLGCIAGGIVLFVRGLANNTTIKKRAFLKTIIDLAKKSSGKITAIELSGATGMSIEESTKMLGDYSKKGIFETQVTEKGTVVYNVGNIPTAEEKQNIIS
jgi:hypothetical protein